MSHSKEREEKVCLNCNADLNGRFCHECGQENREPKLSAWGLITHFFYDITHFDGKFFSTTGLLIRRPGYLPNEYINGRRASYLDPIRMYIFSSAIFFLIFFSVYNIGDVAGVNLPDTEQTIAVLDNAREKVLEKSATQKDSLLVEEQFDQLQKGLKLPGADTASAVDSARKKKARLKKGWNLSLQDINFASKEEYDSAQRSLPADKRDNWLKRKTMLRSIELNKRMGNDQNRFWLDVLEKFFHTFPYLLFVSLPLYALYLKLLYIRRRKFYYVDHGLFLIYLYIFTFIFLLIFVGIDELQDATKWEGLDWLMLGLFGWGVYYAWRAMHKFYGQGRFKTLLKFLLFNFMCLVSIIFLFTLFFILTVFSI